jgi:hypothetical protein
MYYLNKVTFYVESVELKEFHIINMFVIVDLHTV